MPIPHLYSNLARQGLAKSITHGYAQSVVAATHPQAYANHKRTSRFGLNRRGSKVGSHQYLFQNAFHSSTQVTSTLVQEGRPEKGEVSKSDGGLDAYFEAWRKHQAADEPEKEWTQFQFTKLLEWKPSTLNSDAEGINKLKSHTLLVEPPKQVERAHSTSAVDDIKRAELGAAEEAALAAIDAAIETEIKSRTDQAIFEAELSVVAARVPTPPIARSESPAVSTTGSFTKTPTSSFSSLTSAADLQSQSYADHLTKLSDTGRYAEIPAVFEAMLVAGINPTAPAYNALLDAAIHLPAERIQVVPKALDVYSDMLKRKVLPNTATYNTLIGLLSSRSIEVSSLKQSLEEKRVRFGGMEEPGKFMFPSNEFEFAILAEDDRLDLAVRLFEASVTYRKDRAYPPETYHTLIQACSAAGRVPEMIRLYDHMESSNIVPLAATFPHMIKGFTQTGDLSSAVECYNEYKQLAVSHDNGELNIKDRQDGHVYAAVIKAYITSDRVEGANKFYKRILDSYGSNAVTVKDSIINGGFVTGMLDRGLFTEALNWAEGLSSSTKALAMSKIAAAAADKGDKLIAVTAFANIPSTFQGIATPAMAMLALSVRAGDVSLLSDTGIFSRTQRCMYPRPSLSLLRCTLLP